MEPITPNSVLLLPAILILFGGFVYGAALAQGIRDHALPKYRWAGVGLLVVAVVLGARTVWLLVQPDLGDFYRAQLSGRKVVAAHYASLALPILAIVAVVGLEAWFKRYRKAMS